MNRIEKMAEDIGLIGMEKAAFITGYNQALYDFESAAPVLKDTKPLLWLVEKLRGATSKVRWTVKEER